MAAIDDAVDGKNSKANSFVVMNNAMKAFNIIHIDKTNNLKKIQKEFFEMQAKYNYKKEI